MLAFMFVFISRAYASVARINDVLSYKSSMQNPENPVKDEITEGCIEFKTFSLNITTATKTTINTNFAA